MADVATKKYMTSPLHCEMPMSSWQFYKAVQAVHSTRFAALVCDLVHVPRRTYGVRCHADHAVLLTLPELAVLWHKVIKHSMPHRLTARKILVI